MIHSEFRAGIRAELPIALGGIPFGMIYGVLARAAGLPPLPALAMSAIVFAGSAQFIGTQLFAAATPAGFSRVRPCAGQNTRYSVNRSSGAAMNS